MSLKGDRRKMNMLLKEFIKTLRKIFRPTKFDLTLDEFNRIENKKCFYNQERY